MIRIEIRTIFERPSAQSDRRMRRQILKREIERAAEDPIGYQLTNMSSIKIIGFLLDGPLARILIEKRVAEVASAVRGPPPRTLEPLGFPAA